MGTGKVVFHSSIEGAQHGAKGLQGFLAFAKKCGAQGAQPSNFMLEGADGSFLTPAEIKEVFIQNDLRLDGISAHCPFWVHTTAWTGSKTIRPFIPADIAKLSPEDIKEWAENYILRLFDLCAELEVRVVPMFWGVALGWEVASGYPWGLWSGKDYDLVAEGRERFVEKTDRLRHEAGIRNIKLAHEIHPGTAAQCADDFLTLVEDCDFDDCLAVNADPSHCWDGESWEDRFQKVAEYVVGCHVKNHAVRQGFPLRCMEPDWKKRGMQFTDLGSGQINLVRFVELMEKIGYPRQYCDIMGTETAPLVTEAESAFRDLAATAEAAIRYTNSHLLFPFATQSFEDGMGEKN